MISAMRSQNCKRVEGKQKQAFSTALFNAMRDSTQIRAQHQTTAF